MKKTVRLGVLAALLSVALVSCASGSQGPKGDPGEAGSAGATGPRGPQGEPGQDGRGILSIVLIRSEGNVDYYQINYTDGSSYTFTVTNGQNGERGIQGEKGADGTTPTVSIGQNGNWEINGVDTGIKAVGENGKDGKNGNSVLTGNGDPNNGLGVDGDSFINTTSFDFFVKENGQWVLKGNIKGAQGEAGSNGQDGENGTDGNDGQNGSAVLIGNGAPSDGLGSNGDSYIDIDTFDFYLRLNDAWSKIGNIKGNDAWNYNVYYTVNFDCRGGVLPDGYQSQVIVRAMDVITLPEPAKVGYVFQGWFTGDTINDGQFFNYAPVACNLTLYAKWQSGEFLVTFDYNDGITPSSTQSALYGDDYEFPVPERTGYDFVKWTTSNLMGSETEVACSGKWHIAQDVTIKANWAAKSYSIRLYPKDGKVNGQSSGYTVTVTFDSAFSLPDATRDGYEFLGWYIAEDGEITDESFPNEGIYTVPSSIVLHAKWSEPVEYSIAYMAPGATLPEGNPTSYTVNDSIALEKPTDEYGHDYEWYTNNSFTGSAITTFIGKNYLKDMTLWAKPIHTMSTTYTTVEGHRSQTSHCSKCGANEVVRPCQLSGSTLYFGAYPQSYVTDETVKTTLNAMVEIPSASDAKGWIDYHYYYNGSKSDGMMFYKDVVSGKEKYRGVYYTKKRANSSANQTNYGYASPISNSYAVSTIHWFKFEPVQWMKIQGGSTGTLTFISKYSLDHQVYKVGGNTTVNGTTYSSSTYAYSTIRSWLTNEFYSTCFNYEERQVVLTTQVDNSKAVSSTNSVGVSVSAYTDSTSDKVYLPSWADMRNTSYGFVANDKASETRILYATEYSYCQGDTNPSSSGTDYWTRSPSSTVGGYVTTIADDGKISDTGPSVLANRGIRPMLRVNL